MNVVVALLTYYRPWLLERTVETMQDTSKPFTLVAMDNGNGNDVMTAKILADAPCSCRMEREHLPVGKAMNELIDVAVSYTPDLVVFTADDYEYTHWWLDDLIAWWEEAPDDVAITSCHMEDSYPWNTVRGVLGYGGHTGLVRDTLPGSSWTFRPSTWSRTGPLAETTGGEDLLVCRNLLSAGYRLCALDLAKHIGEEQSAWGNQSYKKAKKLDRERWGI